MHKLLGCIGYLQPLIGGGGDSLMKYRPKSTVLIKFVLHCIVYRGPYLHFQVAVTKNGLTARGKRKQNKT